MHGRRSTLERSSNLSTETLHCTIIDPKLHYSALLLTASNDFYQRLKAAKLLLAASSSKLYLPVFQPVIQSLLTHRLRRVASDRTAAPVQ